MAGTGAPKGNQYAKKAQAGHKISLYLTAEDIQLLRYVLQKYEHEDTSDAACFDLARKAAKAGINNLLNPEYYEVVTKRVLNEEKRKRAMQESKLIIALCKEVGAEQNADGTTTTEWTEEELIEGFRSNHHPDLIRDAAKGDVVALAQLRTDCGLSPVC